MSHKNRMVRQQGTVNEVVTVICRIELGERVYDLYAEESMKRGIEVEDIIAERLRNCASISGSGIYFNDAQKKRLSTVLGHTVADAEGALQRLETSTVVDVSGFQFELDPRLVQRLKTRVYRSEQYEDVMYREIVRGLMTFAGMSPSLSNTGGWWRRGKAKEATNGKEPIVRPLQTGDSAGVQPKSAGSNESGLMAGNGSGR